MLLQRLLRLQGQPLRPKLDLLPNPFPETLEDSGIAILSCDGDNYAVACLQIVPHIKPTFKLHLYRSADGKPGKWTSQLLSVEEPLRDKVCPVPDSAERQIYHKTSKVIMLGDGIVGWVDLWRGIILCDVLSECPKLRDLPLPLPAKGNLSNFLNGCPSYFRDITVNQSKNTIKYVEMEITQPEEVFLVPSGCDPDDWMPYYEKQVSIVPGSWTVTTWTMTIPIGTWDDWKPDCSVSLATLIPPVGNQRLQKILDRLLSNSDCGEQVTTGATLSLGFLCMAYPTLSILDDDDDVYFLSKSIGRGIEVLVTVDVRAKILQGVGVLDTGRCFMRHFRASGISKYFKMPGPRASLGQAEEHFRS